MNRQGWVPVQFRRGHGAPLVEWSYLGNLPFREPFFDQTIERVRSRPFNELFTHQTHIDELDRWHEQSPGLAPSGFIFHMSRCGSTLIARMLAALSGALVISEALPLDVLARSRWLHPMEKARWLRSMVGALGQPRSGDETRYFIKFDSPTIVALPFLRQVFPETPWVFVYRDPEEVIVSHLREPAAFMTPGMITDCPLLDAPPHELSELTPEEYTARVLAQICATAAQAFTQQTGGLLVNYSQLPGALETAIARHFALSLTGAELHSLGLVSGLHAKNPRRQFEADGESKRREASDSVRAAALQVAPFYRELERLRLASSS
ncbi:MAG: sulfotransferase family protein [Acidobacteriota bacterium]